MIASEGRIRGVPADAGDAEQDTPDTTGTVEHYDSPAVDWSLLVRRVKAGESEGLEQLYRLFARGIRFHLCRQLGSRELDDRVHDTFLVVVQAVQKGDLREPERLMGFVRTIVRRQVAGYISTNVNQRREHVDLDTGVRVTDLGRNPEESVVTAQQRQLVRRVLDRLNQRDREILTRFYLYEQTQEQICDEMSLTETQFRLLKSRAKTRFGELGKKKLQQQALTTFSMRTSAAGSH
jgi:RNA polymerase sigma-70 factor, ECF subfamily